MKAPRAATASSVSRGTEYAALSVVGHVAALVVEVAPPSPDYGRMIAVRLASSHQGFLAKTRQPRASSAAVRFNTAARVNCTRTRRHFS